MTKRRTEKALKRKSAENMLAEMNLKTEIVFLSLLATAFPNTAAAENVAGTLVAGNAENSPEVYTPARSAVRIRENLITPFYAFCGQTLPAAISGGGKIASSTYGTGFSWRYVKPDKSRISLTNFDYRRTDFRFSGTDVPAPFEHTDALSAMTYQEFIDPETGRALVAIFGAALSAEDGAELGDGFGGMASVAFKQYFSEETAGMLGASIVYRPERERLYFYPVAAFDWRISPNFNLRVLNGAELTWDIDASDEFLVDFSVLYESSAFAVARDDFSDEKGAWREQRVPISVAGTWNVSENIFINARISLIAWSEFRQFRDGGKTDEKFRADPTLAFSVQVGFRF